MAVRGPRAMSGAFMSVDFGDMKRVLDDQKFKLAFSVGMVAAGEVIKQSLVKAAPKFDSPKPQYGWSSGSTPGFLKGSIKLMTVGMGMIYIVSTAESAHWVLTGHDALHTLGQQKWFFANYPGGYTAKHGNPVPANDFPLKMGEVNAVMLQAVAAKFGKLIMGRGM